MVEYKDVKFENVDLTFYNPAYNFKNCIMHNATIKRPSIFSIIKYDFLKLINKLSWRKDHTKSE